MHPENTFVGAIRLGVCPPDPITSFEGKPRSAGELHEYALWEWLSAARLVSVGKSGAMLHNCLTV